MTTEYIVRTLKGKFLAQNENTKNWYITWIYDSAYVFEKLENAEYHKRNAGKRAYIAMYTDELKDIKCPKCEGQLLWRDLNKSSVECTYGKGTLNCDYTSSDVAWIKEVQKVEVAFKDKHSYIIDSEFELGEEAWIITDTPTILQGKVTQIYLESSVIKFDNAQFDTLKKPIIPKIKGYCILYKDSHNQSHESFFDADKIFKTKEELIQWLDPSDRG